MFRVEQKRPRSKSGQWGSAGPVRETREAAESDRPAARAAYPGRPLRVAKVLSAKEREQQRDAGTARMYAEASQPNRRELAAELKAGRLAKLAAKMTAKGWKCEHVSTSGSQYWRTVRGYSIRVADHDIPLTDERIAKINGAGLNRSWNRTIWI